MKQKSKFIAYSLLFLHKITNIHSVTDICLNALKHQICKGALLFIVLITFSTLSKAQLPANVLVGYHENWSALSLIQTGAGTNYNVIELAFGLPKTTGPTGACTCDIVYALPPAYASIAAMVTDINTLHAAGKKVLLSLGGATGPIFLANTTDQTTFISSVNAIFTAYGNVIDGLDLDLETTSMAFGTTWTISSPAAAQTNMVTAIQSIMATYQTTNGKKMLLTAAPEVIYLMGGMSNYQVTNLNGGAFLPILDGLRSQIDLLQMQLYNAGGSTGGVYGWDGNLYYDNGTADFALAMNESVIKGFTCEPVTAKGTWNPFPDTKIAFGFPATTAAATTGYVTPAKICPAVQYFKGLIAKPGGITYTMNTSRPGLKGLMTWDINLDQGNSWNFVTGYTCSFPAPVTLLDFDANRSGNNVYIEWTTANETDNAYYSIERSLDGISFTEIAKIQGLGTSVTGKTYDFTDLNSSTEGSNYYRLAQYDINGAVNYSSIVTVAPVEGTSGLHIGSNPFDDVLLVSPYGNENDEREEASIRVIDCSGKLLTTKNVWINEECQIGEGYKAGFYILEFQYNGEIKRYKVIKQ
jgi:chitinase